MAGIGGKKKIRLEKWTAAKDGLGDFKEAVQKWNLWATVTRTGGGRSSLNGQTSLTSGYQFEIYWKPDIFPTGKYRVAYDGKLLTVNSIEKKGEERFFWLINAEGK